MGAKLYRPASSRGAAGAGANGWLDPTPSSGAEAPERQPSRASEPCRSDLSDELTSVATAATRLVGRGHAQQAETLAAVSPRIRALADLRRAASSGTPADVDDALRALTHHLPPGPAERLRAALDPAAPDAARANAIRRLEVAELSHFVAQMARAEGNPAVTAAAETTLAQSMALLSAAAPVDPEDVEASIARLFETWPRSFPGGEDAWLSTLGLSPEGQRALLDSSSTQSGSKALRQVFEADFDAADVAEWRTALSASDLDRLRAGAALLRLEHRLVELVGRAALTLKVYGPVPAANGRIQTLAAWLPKVLHAADAAQRAGTPVAREAKAIAEALVQTLAHRTEAETKLHALRQTVAERSDGFDRDATLHLLAVVGAAALGAAQRSLEDRALQILENILVTPEDLAARTEALTRLRALHRLGPDNVDGRVRSLQAALLTVATHTGDEALRNRLRGAHDALDPLALREQQLIAAKPLGVQRLIDGVVDRYVPTTGVEELELLFAAVDDAPLKRAAGTLITAAGHATRAQQSGAAFTELPLSEVDAAYQSVLQRLTHLCQDRAIALPLAPALNALRLGLGGAHLAQLLAADPALLTVGRLVSELRQTNPDPAAWSEMSQQLTPIATALLGALDQSGLVDALVDLGPAAERFFQSTPLPAAEVPGADYLRLLREVPFADLAEGLRGLIALPRTDPTALEKGIDWLRVLGALEAEHLLALRIGRDADATEMLPDIAEATARYIRAWAGLGWALFQSRDASEWGTDALLAFLRALSGQLDALLQPAGTRGDPGPSLLLHLGGILQGSALEGAKTPRALAERLGRADLRDALEGSTEALKRAIAPLVSTESSLQALRHLVSDLAGTGTLVVQLGLLAAVTGSAQYTPDEKAELVAQIGGSLDGITVKILQSGAQVLRLMASFEADDGQKAALTSLAQALTPLQDQIPPMDPFTARSVIEDGLGPIEVTESGHWRVARPDGHYDIDPEPAGAASVGGTHRAVYTDAESGERTDVRVKLIRPDVAAGFERATRIAQLASSFLRNLLAMQGDEVLGAEQAQFARLLVGVFEQTLEGLSRQFHQELDPAHEAENLRRLGAQSAHDAQSHVPEVFEASGGVLVMEEIPGFSVAQWTARAQLAAQSPAPPRGPVSSQDAALALAQAWVQANYGLPASRWAQVDRTDQGFEVVLALDPDAHILELSDERVVTSDERVPVGAEWDGATVRRRHATASMSRKQPVVGCRIDARTGDVEPLGPTPRLDAESIQRLAENQFRAFLGQLLGELHHGDPHAGNMLVLPSGDGSPVLVWLDLGLTLKVGLSDLTAPVRVLLAAAQGDTEQSAEAFLRLIEHGLGDATWSDDERTALKRALRSVLMDAVASETQIDPRWQTPGLAPLHRYIETRLRTRGAKFFDADGRVAADEHARLVQALGDLEFDFPGCFDDLDARAQALWAATKTPAPTPASPTTATERWPAPWNRPEDVATNITVARHIATHNGRLDVTKLQDHYEASHGEVAPSDLPERAAAIQRAFFARPGAARAQLAKLRAPFVEREDRARRLLTAGLNYIIESELSLPAQYLQELKALAAQAGNMAQFFDRSALAPRYGLAALRAAADHLVRGRSGTNAAANRAAHHAKATRLREAAADRQALAATPAGQAALRQLAADKAATPSAAKPWLSALEQRGLPRPSADRIEALSDAEQKRRAAQADLASATEDLAGAIRDLVAPNPEAA